MPAIGIREMAAAVTVLGRGQLTRFGLGETSATRKFERALADKVGVRHALATNSGTSALICALVAAGIGPGDEVLVPAYTWVSTAAAPLAVGAVPILVEVDESLTIDPVDARAKISPHTRAIIPVHMLNLVCDMDAISAVAAEFDLVVIEDACQAVGVKYRGKRVGSIGHAGAFSFNQHKNIKSGEGGALLTDHDRWFSRATMYHDVGSYERDGGADSDEPLFVGVNYRMPELLSAILNPQLSRLDGRLAKRSKRREVLVEELERREGLMISPHNDPASAVGLAIGFETADAAARAADSATGVNRLIDTGRHVFTNWQPILQKRSFHPAMDPHRWAHRDIDYGPDSCPKTLDILARTCSVSVDPDVPIAVLRRLVGRLATT